MKRPSGLKRRWMINSLGFVVLFIVVAVAIFSVIMANYYFSGLQISMESRAKDTVQFINTYFNTNYEEYYQSAYRYTSDFADSSKLELQFINTLGRIEFSSSGLTAGMSPGTDDVQTVLKTGQPASWMGRDPATGERVMAVSSPLLFGENQVIGIMRYVTSLQRVDRQILYVALMAVLVGVVVLALVVLSNLYFLRSIISPVRELNDLAKKIASGSYGAKLDKEFNDEIGELCDAINDMSAEISAAERMKTDFISSVSHELRTPLTAIAGWSETLMADGGMDQEEMRKGMRIILSESRRLSKMVEELLEFTRMEGGRMTLQLEQTDVLAEFEEVAYMYMETLRKENIVLNLSEDDEIPEILGDAQRLKQVFFNILDNAAKHGKDGGKIDASITKTDTHVVVAIRDYGAGISQEELPRVKMKFYKGASKARGSGIGLAVSDEIVRLHDGTLDIASTLGEGTTVTISLPIPVRKSSAAEEPGEE